MAVGVSSGITSVTGTVNASFSGLLNPSASQTVVNKFNTCNGSVQTIHTVTVGKTFYLMGYSCAGGVAGVTYIYKPDGTTKVYGRQHAVSDLGQGRDFTTPLWAYASGEAVKIQDANNIEMNVWGFEQ